MNPQTQDIPATIPASTTSTPKTVASTVQASRINRWDIERYPIFACSELWSLSEVCKTTRQGFIGLAKFQTKVSQAEIYRLLALKEFIGEFGELPAELQPPLVSLRELKRKVPAKKILATWMTAIWENQGTAYGMSKATLDAARDCSSRWYPEGGPYSDYPTDTTFLRKNSTRS